MAADDPQIFAAISDWTDRGVAFALATVIGVRGSTYRGLAARQLMAADGTSVGTVSGGCLDQDLTLVVGKVLATGQPTKIEFDLTADDEAVWGWGIGCNGATELLVEPADGARRLVEAVESHPAAVLHVLSGEHLGEHWSLPAADPAWGELVAAAHADGRNRRVTIDEVDYLLEIVARKPRLVVCGAGHDAVPLVSLGSELGFEVTVVDDRRAFLTRERFPHAAALVHCAPSELAAHVPIDPATSVVVMSHNYVRDVDFIGSLLGRRAGYIGCLGPGERLERILKDLEASARVISPEDRQHLHGPAGLDLGADGPVEIAWSVLSEILAVRRHRQGGFLVDKKGPAGLRRIP
ncbi:MAG: XdhC family protein [Actinomycetota bacterium]